MEVPIDLEVTKEDISGPSSISSDQASLCVIPDPDDSLEEDGFIYLDKSGLPANLSLSEQDRTVIVFHSIDEEYPANQDIVCQYIRPDGWQENHKDHICLFKVGWVTKNDAIFMVSLPAPSNDPIGRVLIPVDILPKDTTNLYQFCYMREYTLLGASTPFQFTLPNSKPNSIISEGSQGPIVKDNGFSANYPGQIPNLAVSMEKSFQELDRPSLDGSHYKENLSTSCKGLSASQGNFHEEGASSFSFMDSSLVDLKSACSSTDSESGKRSIFTSDFLSRSVCAEQGKDSFNQPPEVELLNLKKRFGEINEEKKWYQDQYHTLLVTVKKYAEDLSSERSEKVSLNGHLAELAISYKMLCSENTRLHEELQNRIQSEKGCEEKFGLEKKDLENELKILSSENDRLMEQVEYLQSQLKMTKDDGAHQGNAPTECQCEKHKKQLEDLSARLSDYEAIRSCLEVELEEEIKLGLEKDRYIVQLEQVKVNNFQMANNWLASTPNASADRTTLLEMEENIKSTLEALECALKEMEVLRSRKTALSGANRALRDEFVKKTEIWEEKILKLQKEFDTQVQNLQEQIEGEKLSKIGLQEEIDKLTAKLHQLTSDSQLSSVDQTNDNSGAIEAAKHKIESLYLQKTELDKECLLLKERFGRNLKAGEDMNTALLKNLQEARDEYKKLYTEKMRAQEKFTRLQQKVKAKKMSRAHQETLGTSSTRANFMDNVSSSWRATIDELM